MKKLAKFFFYIIMTLVLIVALVFTYARFIEPNRIVSVELAFENPHITAENTDEITIAVFSDVHFHDRHYTPEDFENVINIINERSPDIILFLGDLIDDYSEYYSDIRYISEALSRLDARIGKFAVYGNHDHGGGAHRIFQSVMEDGGFTVFINEHIRLYDYGIILIGIDDFVLGHGDISVVSEFTDENFFNIVFSHVPDVVDDILDYNVDFMIAGHSHGGQVNIGQVRTSYHRSVFFPPYARNYVRGTYFFDNTANTVLHVNSGIGTTMLPLRFMAPPEITFITITPSGHAQNY